MIQHKRGDTFEYLVELPPKNDFKTGWEITCEIRTAMDKLVDSFPCTWPEGDTPGKALIAKKIDTTDWPVGQHSLEIRFVRTQDGYVRSSNTLGIDVYRTMGQA